MEENQDLDLEISAQPATTALPETVLDLPEDPTVLQKEEVDREEVSLDEVGAEDLTAADKDPDHPTVEMLQKIETTILMWTARGEVINPTRRITTRRITTRSGTTRELTEIGVPSPAKIEVTSQVRARILSLTKPQIPRIRSCV